MVGDSISPTARSPNSGEFNRARQDERLGSKPRSKRPSQTPLAQGTLALSTRKLALEPNQEEPNATEFRQFFSSFMM